MIQRIQSIWLLLAGLTILLLLILPIVTQLPDVAEAPKPAVNYLLYGTIVVGLLSFINIFNFKNRGLQKKLVILTVALILGLCGWIFATIQALPGGLNNVKPSIGAFMPVLSIIFSALAYRGIRNDEQLLRSADRLR